MSSTILDCTVTYSFGTRNVLAIVLQLCWQGYVPLVVFRRYQYGTMLSANEMILGIMARESLHLWLGFERGRLRYHAVTVTSHTLAKGRKRSTRLTEHKGDVAKATHATHSKTELVEHCWTMGHAFDFSTETYKSSSGLGNIHSFGASAYWGCHPHSWWNVHVDFVTFCYLKSE